MKFCNKCQNGRFKSFKTVFAQSNLLLRDFKIKLIKKRVFYCCDLLIKKLIVICSVKLVFIKYTYNERKIYGWNL